MERKLDQEGEKTIRLS